MRLLATVLLSSVLTSNTLLTQSPYDIFQKACVENLHDYPNAELFLTQSNWSQANIDTFNEPANTLVKQDPFSPTQFSQAFVWKRPFSWIR